MDQGEGYEKACAYANASGALVVSRHGCSPAIPTPQELDYYIEKQNVIKRPDLDSELNYLHRVTTRKPAQWGELCVLAFDHRQQFIDMADDVNANVAQIPLLKQHILSALTDVANSHAFPYQVGVLIDDTFGQDALNEVTGKQWWIGRPVEVPTSRPIELEGGRSIGTRLVSWPQEHIVKCLVFMHPDDNSEMWNAQRRQIEELYNAVCVSGHELLLEIIPPKDLPSDETTIVRCMEMIYDIGVRPDWWKLPSPSRDAWQAISDLISKRAPHCRGVILLGLDAPIEQLAQSFADSANFPLCRGFAVGRSIFGAPSKAWLAGTIDDSQLKAAIAENYIKLVNAWDKRKEL